MQQNDILASFDGLDRNRALRETCAELITIISKSQITAREQLSLRTGRKKLRDMGVVPEMNMGQDKSCYQTDPIFAAEYIAGQLLVILDDIESRGMPTEKAAIDALRSSRDINTDIARSGFELVEGGTQSAELKRYQVHNAVFGVLRGMLEQSFA